MQVQHVEVYKVSTKSMCISQMTSVYVRASTKPSTLRELSVIQLFVFNTMFVQTLHCII